GNAPGGQGPSVRDAAGAWAEALTSALWRGFVVAIGLDVQPSGSPTLIAGVALLVALVACVVVTRRSHGFNAWMARISAMATAVTFAETTRIREQIIDHEVFWMSALGILDVACIAALLLEQIDGRKLREASHAFLPAMILLVVAAGV